MTQVTSGEFLTSGEIFDLICELMWYKGRPATLVYIGVKAKLHLRIGNDTYEIDSADGRTDFQEAVFKRRREWDAVKEAAAKRRGGE